MSGEITLVPIAPDDIPGFHACLDSVARERRYLGFVEAPPLEKVSEFVTGGPARGTVQFVAVTEEGRVVGWCDVSRGSLEGFSHVGYLGMGVHRDFRGRGIGKRLMEAVLDQARTNGIERVELEVYASNVAAIRLYARMGFTTEGVKRRARKLDGAYDDLVCMALLFEDADA